MRCSKHATPMARRAEILLPRPSYRRTRGTFFETSFARPASACLRALQHFSRWRSQPAAAVRSPRRATDLGHALLGCCGSRAWVKRMAESQPFPTAEQMLEAADRIWWTLTPDDWLRGLRRASGNRRKNADARAGREQSGVDEAAAEDTCQKIAAGNRTY